MLKLVEIIEQLASEVIQSFSNDFTLYIIGRAEKSFERSFVSPCSKYIAILGKDGYILLLSMGNKQLIGTCKMNTGVASIAFSSQNNQLWSLGFDGTVYIWDLDTKLCLHHFVDQGNIRGSSISISPNGQWVALGSSSGVVNLYETKTIMDSKNPEPVKVFMNLTTTVTTMLFHPQSELLVVASKDVKDSLKIIHIPTKRVVKNWPTSLTPLGYVFCAAFSPDGQFLAIGNDKGKVLLYRFEAFANLL
jgi:U3 small nucleolar RNA-associated protein 18